MKNNMKRLMIIGAGASREECKQSGNYPSDESKYLPLIRDFSQKLLQPHSSAVNHVVLSYFNSHKIAFSDEGGSLKPVEAFMQLEKLDSSKHNIETLCEHAWVVYKDMPKNYDNFIYDGIYLNLFVFFTEQFGLGLGVPMNAGKRFARVLSLGDTVINLNYDIAFDLALKQAGIPFCYAPEQRDNCVLVLKPHGSINCYVNHLSGDFYFEDPDKISGSVGRREKGGTFQPYGTIIPPQLNKTYEQHPFARMILKTKRPFTPEIVTFWGVGLTSSDVDLLNIYREATRKTKEIEFINPSDEVCMVAEKLLYRKVHHFRSLEEWEYDRK